MSPATACTNGPTGRGSRPDPACRSVMRLLRSEDVRAKVMGMTSDVVGRPAHEHGSAWPHDDTHHVVAAFALLLLERGVKTIDELSADLTRLQVVRGRIERDSLDHLIEDLEERA